MSSYQITSLPSGSVCSATGGSVSPQYSAILGSSTPPPNPSRQKSISSKNANRTGGQSKGGVGKNAQHGDGGHHSQKAKGQRGSQGPRK